MFMSAAHELAAAVREDDLEQGSLYPPLSSIRDVSAHIAVQVAKVAYRSGLARGEPPADLLAAVRSHMYNPRYVDYTNA